MAAAAVSKSDYQLWIEQFQPDFEAIMRSSRSKNSKY
jgi:hypothetical protein